MKEIKGIARVKFLPGELLGTPNPQIRKNLTGDQPKLFTPWMALSDEPAAAG